MRQTIVFGLLLLLSLGVHANGRRVTFTVNVSRPMDAQPSEFVVAQSLLTQAYGLITTSDVDDALKSGKLNLVATYNTSNGKESFYATRTVSEGYGHWFTKTGLATSKQTSRVICVCFMDGKFYISHDTSGNVAENDHFIVKESFVSKTVTDTITYVFDVTVGGMIASVSSNQQAIAFGRKNYVDSWMVKPQVRINEQDWKQRNYIQTDAGNSITLSAIAPETVKSAKYSWLNAKGKTIRSYKSTADFILSNVTYADGGFYTLKVRMTMEDGTIIVKDYNYFVDVQEHRGEFYDWAAHIVPFSYDFRSEYPELAEPQKVHTFYKRTANGKQAPANQYVGKWWSAFWGDNLNKEVGTDSATVYAAAKRMVDYFDQEFAYLRNKMGWPPDLSARKGYKSIIYIFGSGLTNDNTSPEEQGGYQSATYADGQTWACVWASWYPFSRFRLDADTKWNDGAYQRDAMIHEGIHATFADMPGVKGSSWFHEAGNTWAQSKMAQLKAEEAGNTIEDDNARAGWLDCGPFLAPFMPIECYSGWLQDGTFGGPQAQGVNRYTNDGKQICTWRNILGGTQYGNSFPTILSGFCGTGSVPWIWRYCGYRVLEGIGDSIGEEAMRKVVLQYRSRMAIYDFGYGSKAYRNSASDAFGQAIGPEWEPYYVKCDTWRMTPYAKPILNDNSGWLAPDTLTNPGWSGANFIPIHVDPAAQKAVVEFRPEDTHMEAQLCYRTKDGKAYYSQPVYCGKIELDISDRPANEVIICVVANTDYIYDDNNGEWQRSHHWDYRIRLNEGCMAVADNYQKWFFYERNITDPTFDPTGIDEVESEEWSVKRLNNTQSVYNLQGQRLNNLQKGLNIVNGKKLYIK